MVSREEVEDLEALELDGVLREVQDTLRPYVARSYGKVFRALVSALHGIEEARKELMVTYPGEK